MAKALSLLFFIFLNINIVFSSSKVMNSEELDKLALNNFRNYLRIPSVHPDINYSELNYFKQILH